MLDFEGYRDEKDISCHEGTYIIRREEYNPTKSGKQRQNDGDI